MCPTCVLTVHKEHHMIEISVGYILIKGMLQMDQKGIENLLINVASLTHNLEQLKEVHKQKTSEEIRKIITHGEKL